jgi:electron transfer flavoprotein alpha subunit
MNTIAEEAKKVLIVTERKGPALAPTTLGLLGMGRKIATGLGEGVSLCAAVMGRETGGISREAALFADRVYALDHPLLDPFDPELHTKALEQLVQKVKPSAVVMGGGIDHLTLAPRLAYKMGVEVITDCVGVDVEEKTGHLLCKKPVYGAKIFSTFRLDREPFLVAIRPKSAEPIGPAPGPCKIIRFDPVIDESMMRVRVIEKVKEESVDLTKAEAIVAGGRGIGDAHGLERLKELIKVLGKYFKRVELGATRPLVDSHLVPSSRQVGLTGEKVAPELYIAVGISGSMQHLTGIAGAKKIVAINSSSKAYIFEVADYGVIGGFEEVLPAFRRKLEEIQ